ncbi:MAG: shikimate kinase, partial [Clostridia bacterium]|nr:shikimate kinase [Clostridia bacterium]
GRESIESDREIVRKAGKTIPEIFKEDGEDAFRTFETAVIREVSLRKGVILVTGGGAVKSEENRALLSASGRVYRIDRELSNLATEGRPLSENADLEKMLAEREPFYQAASDVTIKNDRSPEGAAVRFWDEFCAFFAG